MSLIENVQKCYDVKSGRMKPKHCPIMMEKGDFQLAYVAEDVQNSEGNSFLVVLTMFNGQKMHPKLIKFTKDGNYWTVPQDKPSDLTTIQGLTWDFIRQNAMAEKDEERRGDWWVDFCEGVEKNPLDKALLAELIAAQKKPYDTWLEEEEKKGEVTEEVKTATKRKMYKQRIPTQENREESLPNCSNIQIPLDTQAKPINCWVIAGKALIVLAKRILIFDYNNLKAVPTEVRLMDIH